MTDATIIRPSTIIERIATLVEARFNCIASGNGKWQASWEIELDFIARNRLPSGSGLDCGTSIDLDASTPDRIVLNTEFHHMTEGYYDGWTSHKITVRPGFAGLRIHVGGRDRNGIKDYLADTFSAVLNEAY